MAVYHCVHNHLIGKGNGDVYADYRNGMSVFVRIEFCEPDQLNDIEKERIADLDPERRYNIVSGGATIREDKEGNISKRCRITIKRLNAYYSSILSAHVFLDGVGVGKIKNNDKLAISTTEGFHELEIKNTLTKNMKKTVDLREGDVLILTPTMTGWKIEQ